MATIGLRDIHYAILRNDPAPAIAPVALPVYDSPVFLSGAMTVDIKQNVSALSLFKDSSPNSNTMLDGVTVEMNLADISVQHQAILLGHAVQQNILLRRANDVPPWVAIGFRSLKSNGKYKYVWLAKGKFIVPDATYGTKGNGVEFQTMKIAGIFIKRDCDQEWQRDADEDQYEPSIANWFTSPIIGTTGLNNGATGTGAGFELDGVKIKNPDSFRIEPYTITDADRTADGNMVMDFIANKQKFILGYNAINHLELNTILEILWKNLATTREMFRTFKYPRNNTFQTSIVYAGSIPHELHRADSSLWVWKGVQFSLIER